MCRFLTLWMVPVSPTVVPLLDDSDLSKGINGNFLCLFISAMFPWCVHIHVWHWEPQKLRMCNIEQVLPFQLWVSQGSYLVLLICFPDLEWLCWALTMCWQNEQVRAPISLVPVVFYARVNLCGPSQWGLLRESEASRGQPTIVQSHLSH